MMSSSARPARIRSGIGTELALSGSTGAPAVVSVGGSSEPSEGSAPVVSVVSVVSVPVVSVAAPRPASDRWWRAVRARRACGSGARAGCRPSRSSSRARRAAGSRSRRRSNAGRTSRRPGRCRTSRRSPGGRTTGRRRRATRRRASRETQPGRRAHGVLLGPARGWRRGIKVVVPGRSPRELRGMVQSLSDGIEVGVSGW